MKKIIRRNIPEITTPIHSDLLLHNIFAARGISSALDLDNGLNNLLPYVSLLGIKEAVRLLVDALNNNENVLIVGDFDADGATSTALAVLALKSFGFKKVSYLIPNRFEYSYGLTPQIVAVAKERNPDLIITVDNGIASLDGVLAAKSLGIKVIVTDHHLAGLTLPNADAIVNPNQPGDEFPSKNLAGVGVIFYLMLALRSSLRAIGKFAELGLEVPNMAQFLDLVAIGTIADVVPLDRNNRILVSQGLQRIRNNQTRSGVKALLSLAKKTCDEATTSDLGYVIGPRINAAGRLDDISLGIECLLTESADRAHAICYKLEALNQERREIEQDMQKQAFRVLDNLSLDKELPLGVCLFEESWHQGVLGILASRLKDRLYRPVICFGESNDYDELRGSARSIPDLHIRDILNAIHIKYPEMIIRFGGHASAAGLSLKRENFTAFNEAFIAEVAEHASLLKLQNCVYSDGELPTSYFSQKFAQTLRELGPWGHGFQEPLFDNVFEVVDQRIVGSNHLKLTLRIPSSTQIVDAICFNIDSKHWPNYHCRAVHLVYRLDINKYNGRSSLQLVGESLQAKTRSQNNF